MKELLFFYVAFHEHLYKALLLRSQLPLLWNCRRWHFSRFYRFVTGLTYLLLRRGVTSYDHFHPQNFHTNSATAIQNSAEPRKTASQALRFSSGSLCGSSLPDGIANLIQSTSLIILTPNNWRDLSSLEINPN